MAEVAGRYLRAFFDTCEENGADADALLKTLPAPSSLADMESQRFHGHVLLDMLAVAEDNTGDGALGLKCGQALRPKTFHEVGFGVMACGTLREAIAFNARYQRITQTLGKTWLEVDGDEAVLVWEPVLECVEYVRPLTEAVFAGYAAIGRWLTWQQDLTMFQMSFRHAPVPHAEFARSVFGCPVEFESGEDRLRFPASIVDAPLPQANPELVSLMSERLERQLSALDSPQTFSDRTRAAIETLLPSRRASTPQVAAQLGLSERSLRRRLSEEGTRFGALLEDARKEACQLYLREGRHTVAEIAHLLGYSEQSAFNRAFRNWFSMSPMAWKNGGGT